MGTRITREQVEFLNICEEKTRELYVTKQAEIEIEMLYYNDFQNARITLEDLKAKGINNMVDAVYSNILFQEHELDRNGNFTGWTFPRGKKNGVRFCGKERMKDIIRDTIKKYFDI